MNMLLVLIGVFFILHGLVHLLYVGQSRRLFELRPGMTWPDGSWAFSKLPGNPTTRWLASIALCLAALGFITGGLGLFLQQDWWHPLALGSALFSSAIFLLFWDARFQALDEKGGIGILINLAILVVLFILN